MKTDGACILDGIQIGPSGIRAGRTCVLPGRFSEVSGMEADGAADVEPQLESAAPSTFRCVKRKKKRENIERHPFEQFGCRALHPITLPYGRQADSR